MQCTVLQPKGTLRTSTFPTSVVGIPTTKDVAGVLKRATEPASIGTWRWKDMTLHLFGYKTGKAGTETKHELPEPHSLTLYGEVVVAATKDALVAFPSASWTDFLQDQEDKEDKDSEDEEEDEEEEQEKDEEDEEEAVEESESESESEEELVEEPAEEEVPLPVYKAPRAKRSVKKTPNWLSLPPITLDQPHATRTAALQQLQHFLHSQLPPSEITMLEEGLLQHTMAEARRLHVHPVWENREFAILYDVQVRRVICNLSRASYVENPRLDARYQEGEFTAAELPTMPFTSLCPDKWKDLTEREMKREAKMLEVDKSMATDMFRCSKCGKRQCTYYEMQTRSADEPMTIFVRCLNCGKRWRQ